jgi:hypothetical protein
VVSHSLAQTFLSSFSFLESQQDWRKKKMMIIAPEAACRCCCFQISLAASKDQSLVSKLCNALRGHSQLVIQSSSMQFMVGFSLSLSLSPIISELRDCLNLVHFDSFQSQAISDQPHTHTHKFQILFLGWLQTSAIQHMLQHHKTMSETGCCLAKICCNIIRQKV